MEELRSKRSISYNKVVEEIFFHLQKTSRDLEVQNSITSS